MNNYNENYSLENIKDYINGVLYEEQWKPILGWEDLYQISSFGRVKALKRYIPHYAGGLALMKEKIIKLNDRKGYLGANLFRSQMDKAKFGVHRLVALAFIPNIENKSTVNHIDTNKKNNFYKNLEWASHSEQQMHALSNGLRNKTIGENSNFCKLDKNKVIEIRNIFNNKKMTISELSNYFNTSYNNIRSIVNMQTWKHL